MLRPGRLLTLPQMLDKSRTKGLGAKRTSLVNLASAPWKIGFFTDESLGEKHKTLRIRNVSKMDRLLGKRVSLLLSVTFTGSDKHWLTA
jgi:hypothetical protein